MLAVEDLVDLGERLRAEDFKLAPHQLLSAQQVLMSLEANGLLPKRRFELAPWLGPVFCSSPAEQRRFPETFNAWLREHFADVVPEKAPEQLAVPHAPAVPPRLRVVWKPALALIVMLLAAVTAWAGWQHWRPRVITGAVIGAADGAVLSGAILELEGQTPYGTLEDGSFRIVTRAADLPATLRISKTGFAPKSLPIGAELTARRRQLYLGANPAGIALAQIELVAEQPPEAVEIELPPVRAAAPAPIKLTRTLDLRPSLPLPTFWEGLSSADLAWTLAPVFAFLLWQVWRVTRRPVLQRQASSTAPLLREMHLPPGVAPLAPGLPMRRLAQELRRRRVVNSAELQVDMTIAATLRNAGLFTPVVGSRVEPDYLALIDTACLSDHQARLCNEFVNELTRSDVLIDRYTFDRTPAMCERRELQLGVAAVPLDELLARTPEHRVLLFCDGSGLFDPFTGAPAPCVATLLQWETPFILTGKSVDTWGETEWALENLGFKVLPLTREGVLWLMSTLSGAPAPQLARLKANVDRPVPRYDRARRRWLERNPPELAEVRRLCDALRSDLGERGFAWLAACAAYPEIHWGITLRVGAALLPNATELEQLLPKLARLIWMRDAYMPDWLRQALLDRLSAQDETSIRDVMHTMLGTLSAEPGADVPLRIATPVPAAVSGWRAAVARVRAMLDVWRKRRRSESVIRSAHADSPLRDYVFLRFISGQSVGKLSVSAPGTFLKLLFRGGSPFLGFRPALALLTALIASGAIAVAVGPFKTGELYTPLLAVQLSADGGTIAAPFAAVLIPDDTAAEIARGGTAFAKSDGTVDRIVMTGTLGRLNVALSANQRYLAFFDESSDVPDVVVRDLETGTEVLRRQAAPCDDFEHCLRFSSDSRVLAYAGIGPNVGIWYTSEPRDSTVPIQAPASSRITSVALSTDGRLLAAHTTNEFRANTPTRETLVLESGTSRVLGRIPTAESPKALEFSPDARQLIGAAGSNLYVWDIASGRAVREMSLAKRDDEVVAMAVRADGRLLAVAHSENIPEAGGALTIFDLASGARLDELAVAEGPSYLDVAFSADGRALAGAGYDGTVSLWRLPESYPVPLARRSLALVVANAYPSRSIDAPYPLPVAQQIADLLRERYGFGVTVLANASGAQLLQALGKLSELLQPDDQLLIYLAGEGGVDRTSVYWFRGANGLDDLVRGEDIASALHSIRAGQVLVIADTDGARSIASLADTGSQRPSPGSRELIASYTEGRPDPGTRRRFSPFALGFLAALRAARSGHSSEWVFAETQRQMQRANEKDVQRPSYARIAAAGDRPGAFQFPAPRPQPVDQTPVQSTAPTTTPNAPPQQQQPPPLARLDISGDVTPQNGAYVMQFGEVSIGASSPSLSLRVANAEVSKVNLRRSEAGDYSGRAHYEVDDGCSGATLGPKESCLVSIRFKPGAEGLHELRLGFSAEGVQPVEILLRGTGVGGGAKPASPSGLKAQ